jgi:hypothetical protein
MPITAAIPTSMVTEPNKEVDVEASGVSLSNCKTLLCDAVADFNPPTLLNTSARMGLLSA